MTITQIQYFLALAQEGSYTKAAEHLYITQPTLSQQIKKIELELHATLFYRTHQSVNLTSQGKEFLPYAMSIYKTYVEAQQSLSKDALAGNLKIGLPWTFGYHKIDALLNRYQEKYPAVNLQYVIDGSATFLSKIRSEQLDAAFITGAIPEDPSLTCEMYDISPMLAVMSATHPLAGHSTLQSCDFAKEKVLMTAPHSNIYSLMKPFGQDAEIIGYTSQADVICQAASSNLCIGFLSAVAFAQVSHAHCVGIPLAPAIFLHLSLVHRKKAVRKPLQALCEMITPPHYVPYSGFRK